MKVFFDHISATPALPEVVGAMSPFFSEHYGNPSSHLTEPGIIAGRALDEARGKVAALMNASPDEIIFTSCGTEGNNLAMKGLARANRRRGNRIIISAIEHYSVMLAAEELRREGFEVAYVPVDRDGMIHPERVKEALTDDTALISIIHASTEIGTIQPIREIAEIASERGIPFHSDGVGSVGVIPVDVKELGVDAMTLAAQSFYGPKGAAALYLRKGLRVVPLTQGGFQELGRRPGTENVPGVVGMGAAAEVAAKEMEKRQGHLLHLRNRLMKGISERLEHFHFTGHTEKRLPGHVSFWVEYAEGESLVLFLNMHGIFTVSGSACSSPDLQASHVLTAIGVPPEFCHGSLTMSLGKDNTEEEVDYVLETLPKVVRRLWEMSPLYADRMKQGG